MLVNDRQMVSFMSDRVWSRWWTRRMRLPRPEEGSPGLITQFQSTGFETCFHGRHISPQIYAGLDGSNWG